jgi:membrane protease YdiL (CAAX protease family)
MAVAVLRSRDGRVRAVWRFLVAVLLFLASQTTVSLLFRPAQLISARAAIAFAIILAINVGLFAMVSRMLDRATNPLAYIGFPRDVPVLRLIAVGFVLGAVLVSLAVFFIAVGGSTTFRWRMNGMMLQAAAVQLALFPIAALHEEVAFRGYPFQRLIESIGAWPAIAVLSLLFAVPHLGNPNSTIFAAFNTAAIGALLAIAYVFTRSLWLVWGIHWGWNLVLAVAYGLVVSGFDTDGPVDGSVAGPEWLTGGAYGIEGGASGSIAIVIGFGMLFWLVRQRSLVGQPAPRPMSYVAAARPISGERGPAPSASSSSSSSG